MIFEETNLHGMFADGEPVEATPFPIMDDEDAAENHYRAWALAEMDKFKRSFIRPLVSLRTLPTDCLLFANQFGYRIGCNSLQDIADRYGVTKANVNKYVKRFQRMGRLPEVAGQRTKEACQHMKVARQRQLDR